MRVLFMTEGNCVKNKVEEFTSQHTLEIYDLEELERIYSIPFHSFSLLDMIVSKLCTLTFLTLRYGT